MTTRLLYLFDPLCGWCYASAPALAALAHAFPEQLEMWPSGLFAGEGARDLTPEWGEYAWGNDQRIAAMTGQVFSEAYRINVLQGSGVRFDSTVQNRALTWARDLAPALESQLLHRLQTARYVDGLDTALAGVVGGIAATVASAAGHQVDVQQLIGDLESDAALIRKTGGRLQATQALMRDAGIRGVPQLLVRRDDEVQAVSSTALYQGSGTLVSTIRQLLGH